jgi:hypothetical protein
VFDYQHDPLGLGVPLVVTHWIDDEFAEDEQHPEYRKDRHYRNTIVTIVHSPSFHYAFYPNEAKAGASEPAPAAAPAPPSDPPRQEPEPAPEPYHPDFDNPVDFDYAPPDLSHAKQDANATRSEAADNNWKTHYLKFVAFSLAASTAKGRKCDFCSDDKQTPPWCFCEECGAFLCQSCDSLIHTRLPRAAVHARFALTASGRRLIVWPRASTPTVRLHCPCGSSAGYGVRRLTLVSFYSTAQVNVELHGCEIPAANQLFARGWLVASPIKFSMVFDCRLLETLYNLYFSSYLSVDRFCKTLERLHDATAGFPTHCRKQLYDPLAALFPHYCMLRFSGDDFSSLGLKYIERCPICIPFEAQGVATALHIDACFQTFRLKNAGGSSSKPLLDECGLLAPQDEVNALIVALEDLSSRSKSKQPTKSKAKSALDDLVDSHGSEPVTFLLLIPPLHSCFLSFSFSFSWPVSSVCKYPRGDFQCLSAHQILNCQIRERFYVVGLSSWHGNFSIVYSVSLFFFISVVLLLINVLPGLDTHCI